MCRDTEEYVACGRVATARDMLKRSGVRFPIRIFARVLFFVRYEGSSKLLARASTNRMVRKLSHLESRALHTRYGIWQLSYLRRNSFGGSRMLMCHGYAPDTIRHATQANKPDLCRDIWRFGEKLKTSRVSYDMSPTCRRHIQISCQSMPPTDHGGRNGHVRQRQRLCCSVLV